MNHKQKIKLARKMAGKKNKAGIFSTDAWQKRKEAISEQIAKKEFQIQETIKIKKKKLKKAKALLFKKKK